MANIDVTVLGVPGAIKSQEYGGYTVSADQVFDTGIGKRQSELNLMIGSGGPGGGTTWYESGESSTVVSTLRPGTGLAIQDGSLYVTSAGESGDVLVVEYTAGSITSVASTSSQLATLFSTLSSEGVVYPFSKVLILKDNAGHIANCDLSYASAQTGAAVNALCYTVDGLRYKLTSSKIERMRDGTSIYNGSAMVPGLVLGNGLRIESGDTAVLTTSIKVIDVQGEYDGSYTLDFPISETGTHGGSCTHLIDYIANQDITPSSYEQNPTFILLANSYEHIVAITGLEWGPRNGVIGLIGFYYFVNGLSFRMSVESGVENVGATRLSKSGTSYPDLALGSEFVVQAGSLRIPSLQWQD